MTPNPFLRAGTPRTLMMISAKGGVGKSTMTVNLAAALTARGKRVGIFDADLHGPDIPALLGVRQRRKLTGGRAAGAMLPIEARPDALDLRPIQPFERYGLKIMSLALLVGDDQPITPANETTGQIVSLMLQRVNWDETDVVLIDMPPGTGEPFETFLRAGQIDGALLITVREQLGPPRQRAAGQPAQSAPHSGARRGREHDPRHLPALRRDRLNSIPRPPLAKRFTVTRRCWRRSRFIRT